MAMREERGYQTYPLDTAQNIARVEIVEEVEPEMPHTTPPAREWDGVRWVEPTQNMTDEAEEETESAPELEGLYSTRMKCDGCGTANFNVQPERTHGSIYVMDIWTGFTMLFCPVCGNGKSHIVTTDKNNIGYWLLGLKKIE